MPFIEDIAFYIYISFYILLCCVYGNAGGKMGGSLLMWYEEKAVIA